jgi:predicted nuclease of restriction endonuclease-like RecB superfamily
MLSPEHVRVRRQGRELKLLSLSGELKERAQAIARAMIEAARSGIGEARAEIATEWSQISVAPREKRLAQGLAKLLEESSEFEASEGTRAAEVRAEVFDAAQKARKSGEFARERVLAEVAAARGSDPKTLEAELYADLRGAQRLVACHAPSAEELVERYERAQVQAILIRAVRVTCHIRCSSADHYREIFSKLKFRRLMHRISSHPDGGYRLEIDGPFSLFQSVSKYGIELALMLPVLEAADELELEAEVRWTERSGALTFRHRAGGGAAATVETGGREEVRELVSALSVPGTGWRATRSERILNLPGLGVCVPDIVLERERDGAEVLVEVLGFWSRASVWKRVELAERGLGAKVLFAVNARLRVSEDVLENDAGACLYVFKNRVVAKALLERAAALADFTPRAP